MVEAFEDAEACRARFIAMIRDADARDLSFERYEMRACACARKIMRAACRKDVAVRSAAMPRR